MYISKAKEIKYSVKAYSGYRLLCSSANFGFCMESDTKTGK